MVRAVVERLGEPDPDRGIPSCSGVSARQASITRTVAQTWCPNAYSIEDRLTRSP
jgi:hypothetical protein